MKITWIAYLLAVIFPIVVYAIVIKPLSPSTEELRLGFSAKQFFSAQLEDSPLSFTSSPVSTSLSLLGSLMFSPNTFRIPNLIATMVFTLILIKLAQKTSHQILSMFFLFSIPGFLYIFAFEYKYLLTLIFVALLIKKPNFLTLLTCSLTSLSGSIFSLIYYFIIFPKSSKTSSFVMGTSLLLILILSIPNTAVNFYQDSLPSKQVSAVDQHVRNEFKVNNYQEIIPLKLKRIVYNKYYFSFRDISQKFLQNLSIEKWSFPGQTNTTVSKNLWSSKNLPWMPVWILLLFCLNFNSLSKNLKKLCLVFLFSTFTYWVLNPIAQFPANITLLIIPAILVGSTFTATSGVKLLISSALSVLLFLSSIPLYFQLIYQELTWRDNRPFLLTEIAKSAADNNTPLQITTTIGNPIYHLLFYSNAQNSEITQALNSNRFRQFEFGHITSDSLSAKKGLITFPGEILGKRDNNQFDQSEVPPQFTLQKTIISKDSVSFGNGDVLWLLIPKNP